MPITQKLMSFWRATNNRCVNKISKAIILFVVIGLLLYIVVAKMMSTKITPTQEKQITALYGNEKFVTFNLKSSLDSCGSLGNMLWRTASMYAIGNILNRTVYFETDDKCFYEYKQEFKLIFKDNYKIFNFMDPKPELVKMINFGPECCRFDDPIRLIDEKDKILKFVGNYFQSYKYFKDFNNKIRKIFTFNGEIVKKGDQYAKQLLKHQINGYRLCVYIKPDEFIELENSPSKYFAETSIKYVMRSVEKRFDNVSVVLLGEDKNFLQEIDVDYNDTKVYIPDIKDRGVDMYFAIKYCHALIITASTSTYAWWIAYLMPEGTPIYYYNCIRECKHISKRDYFPPDWIPLKVNIKGRVEMDDNKYD